MQQEQLEEMVKISDANEGVITTENAREDGVSNSVLTRLVHRGGLDRVARGVYRLRFIPPDRFAQYREAVAWAKGNRGPDAVAISHESALAVYGVSDASPARIHMTLPKSKRFRRVIPKGFVLHRAELPPEDIDVHEAVPVTTIRRTVVDLLAANTQTELVRQAIRDARREGFIGTPEARRLRRLVDKHIASFTGSPGKAS